MMTKDQLNQLQEQLPPLHFAPKQDCAWAECELAQQYLNAYQINFSHEFPKLTHGFGVVEAEGFRIATHYWLPKKVKGSEIKGTVVIVHGYFDHVGVFKNAIRFALQQHFAVLAFDLPGHGLSSGEPAVINSFDQYTDVLAVMLEKSQTLMPQPLYALGQSTGCAVLLNYLWRYALTQNAVEKFHKIALCSPLILARGWRGWAMGQYAYEVLRYFIQFLPRGPANSSHDNAFNQFIMQSDPLQSQKTSVRWIGAMKAWDNSFRHFAPLQKELLIVQGSGDKTVDWQYNIPLIQQKLPNATLVMVEGAGHQLVNESEPYRQQVFASIENYFA